MENYNRMTLRDAAFLANPRSWVASVYPAIFGILYCMMEGLSLNVFQMIALIMACALLQSAVNTLNDCADYMTGTDSRADCNLEENDNIMACRNIRPKAAFLLGAGYLIAGVVIGGMACIHSSCIPLILGAIGALVVVMYSLGPFPISYYPFGELCSGVVMGGMIPLAIVSIPLGAIDLKVLLLAMPLIIGIGLIMMTNNGSDVEKDLSAGRKTLPIVLGKKKTIAVYRILHAVWFALVCFIPVIRWGWLGIIGIVLLIVLARKNMIHQFKSKLLKEDRIENMIFIVKTNLSVNGVLLMTMFVILIGRVVNV